MNIKEYFEKGCLCILTEKIEKFKGDDEIGAENYYLNSCTCSRHPESSTRDCWDRHDKRSNPQILKDYYTVKLLKSNI